MPKVENEEIYEYVLNRSRKLYSKPQVEVFTTKKTNEKEQPKKETQATVATDEKKGETSQKDEIQISRVTKEANRDISSEVERFKEQERKKQSKRTHRKLQETIASIGARYNWGAFIEYKVTNPVGLIDVVLNTGESKLAIEVSVTNKVEYEVKNIQKCLSNGYDAVLMCCDNTTHLNNIRIKTQDILKETDLQKVWFGSLSQLDEFLHTLHKEMTPKPKTIRGFKVTAKYRESNKGSRGNILKTLLKGKKD